MLFIFFLAATSLNANHNYKSLRKCKKFFAYNNMRYEYIEKKDKVSVSISVNQTDDFDPSKIKNYSQIKAGFTDWKEHNNVELGYGLGSWGVVQKWGKRKLLLFNARAIMDYKILYGRLV